MSDRETAGVSLHIRTMKRTRRTRRVSQVGVRIQMLAVVIRYKFSNYNGAYVINMLRGP